MATLNEATASKDAFAVLQQTIESNVLEQLQGPLSRIVHSAIRKGVIAASQTPAEAPSEPTVVAEVQVTRPADGGLCAKVWDTLDKMLADKKAIPSLQEVQKLAKRKRWNANTARVQYYRWRSTQPAANAS